MSIAVTIVIAPSRSLRCVLLGFGASLLAAACAVASCASTGFTAAPAVAAALLFAGVCVAHAALRAAMVHRIDISGPGQLRLTVQQGVRPDACKAMPARLLPGSTLWPGLMLLQLGADGDRDAGTALAGADGWRGWRRLFRGPARYSVAILSDSVPPEAFRALAVALGAGSGAADASSTGHKIL